MFDGWKVAAAVGLVGLIATGGMYAWVKVEQGEKATAVAELSKAQTVIAGLKGQNTELKAAVIAADAERKLADDRAAVAGSAAAESSDRADATQARYEHERQLLKGDCGPAAPALRYAANSMRLVGARIEGMRSGDDHEGGPRPVPGAERSPPDTPAADGSWPTGQCEFADIALGWSFYAERLVQKLSAIPAWEAKDAAAIAPSH